MEPLLPCKDVIFDRVNVDYLTLGGARVCWFISSHFRQPAPWVFQLQVAESDIPSANWTNVGPPLINTFFAIDPNQRYWGKEENAFYRVQLTDGNSITYTSAAVDTKGLLDFKTWHFARELIRKEDLRQRRLRVGTKGWLLKAKQSGVPCPICLDTRTGEVTDSNCPICYGQRWEGGFYNPLPAFFGDLPPVSMYMNRNLEQGAGMVDVQTTKGIFLALPFIVMGDVWVNNTSDLRYQVHQVQTLTHMRGVPVIIMAELRTIPTDWIVYSFPVPKELEC